jgi:hypothetical protein
MRAEVKGGDVAAAVAATSSLLGSRPVKTVVDVSDVDQVLTINEAGKAFRDGPKTVEALKEGEMGSQSRGGSTRPRDLLGGEVVANRCDTSVARAD